MDSIAARQLGHVWKLRDSSSSRSNAIRSWLQDLGFNVVVTSDRAQIGPACGYVAARATNLMFAAGGEWRSIDVSDAADQFHIDKGNEFLENGWVDANYLDTSDVLFLTQKFRGLAFPDEPVVPFTTAFACQLWPANSCILYCLSTCTLGALTRAFESHNKHQSAYTISKSYRYECLAFARLSGKDMTCSM